MSYCYSCGKELGEDEGVALAIPPDPQIYDYHIKCFDQVRKNQSKLIQKEGDSKDE